MQLIFYLEYLCPTLRKILYHPVENIFSRFEWSVPEDKVKEHTLDITVKNDVSFFSKSKTSMGQVWSFFFSLT